MAFERILRFMDEALNEAKQSFEMNCIPVGSVIVFNDEIVSNSGNRSESFLMHAEIECIKKAEKVVGSRYLDSCEIFTTLEPCMMCYHAIFFSKIRRVFFGAFCNSGNCCYKKNIECYGGFREKESSILLKNFFFNKRKNLLT